MFCFVKEVEAGAYPGTVWCLAAGILRGTHRRTSLVHSHTDTGTGNWSNCTHRCLSGYRFRGILEQIGIGEMLCPFADMNPAGLLPLQTKPSGPSS